MEKIKYQDSNISPEIMRAVADMGFEYMTPIQALTIPVLLVGRDVIGQAQTGTGKTASFGIPMIEKIVPEESGVQGLVLCPTRELAVQAAEEIRKLAKYKSSIKVVPIYGGQDIEKQIKALRGNASIVVGTPGRVMDHMRRHTLKLQNLKLFVLDEADEMLNMGFREDIELIFQSLPEEKQTVLFSATMPKEILEIAREYQNNAKVLKVAEQELTIPLVKQSYYMVKGREKDSSLCRLIDYLSPKKCLIFCNTKKKVDELTLMLKGRGYYAEGLHGDLSQHQRDRVMNLFRHGTLEILLATDVAARGIDVDDVDMVFNYDMPQDMEYYVHRIGRTGRAGKKGKAFSIITPKEKYKIKSLREFCKAEILEKQLPSAAVVNESKAYKTIENALASTEDMDLTVFMQMIYKKCRDEDKDALQVAAALLRSSMGELLEEHDDVKDGRERQKDGRRRGRRDGKSDRRDDRRDGRKDGHKGDYKEKSFGKNNSNGKVKKDEKGSKTKSKNRRHDGGRPRPRKK